MMSPVAHPLLMAGRMEKLKSMRIVLACRLVLTLSSVAEAGNLTLAWNPNSDGNTTGYRVYWGHQSGVYGGSVDVGNVTTWRFNGLADGVPYYFVMRAYNAAGVLSAPSIEVSTRVGVKTATTGDFSGDFMSEMTVFRPLTGAWYMRGMGSVTWGGGGDIPVTGDYDGDGKVDIAVFRPSTGVWVHPPRSATGTGDARSRTRLEDVPDSIRGSKDRDVGLAISIVVACHRHVPAPTPCRETPA